MSWGGGEGTMKVNYQFARYQNNTYPASDGNSVPTGSPGEYDGDDGSKKIVHIENQHGRQSYSNIWSMY